MKQHLASARRLPVLDIPGALPHSPLDKSNLQQKVDVCVTWCAISTALRMANTIAKIRGTPQRNLSKDETGEESLLEDLISRVPAKETWDAQLCLGMLVAG